MSSISQSLLQNPTQLQLLPATAVAEFGSTLVVAPHPDDESLGCGGAIALLKQLSYTVRVLVVSDGTLSHPNSRAFPTPALAALRQQEALTALSILGVEAADVTFLRLKDGSVPINTTPGFDTAIALVRDYLISFTPATILLPWRRDPHADHRASWELVCTAIADLHISPRLLEYPIWDWDPNQRGDALDADAITAWRLDISTVLQQKLQAITAHRSQITDLIDDDPQGFRLTPEMLAHFAHPWELYLEV